ncbi:MAG: cobalamin biosynthesis protein [Clostridium sp.]|nr:cobalamin biosynthesis protein [Clostridium sp.]
MAGICMISFTDRGKITAEKLKEGLFGAGHTVKAEAFSDIRMSLRKYTEQHFYEKDAMIFVGAAGIAVRAIAPWVRSKETDPAVLCVDEAGRFVIPLLSGHLGGANGLAMLAAEILGAVPVITTATDLRQAFAVDVFAKKNQLTILNLKTAKGISAAILRGERVGLFSELTILGDMPPELSPEEPQQYNIVIADGTGERGKALLRKAEETWTWRLQYGTGESEACNEETAGKTTRGEAAQEEAAQEEAAQEEGSAEDSLLVLAARRAVLGLGCRRGASNRQVREAAETALREAKVSFLELSGIATIDRKKDEPALLDLAARWRLPLLTYSAEEMENVSGTYSNSDFVRQTVGIGNVCERAAVLALTEQFSGELPEEAEGFDDRSLILRKKADDGVTAAVAAVPQGNGGRRKLRF